MFCFQCVLLCFVSDLTAPICRMLKLCLSFSFDCAVLLGVSWDNIMGNAMSIHMPYVLICVSRGNPGLVKVMRMHRCQVKLPLKPFVSGYCVMSWCIGGINCMLCVGT